MEHAKKLSRRTTREEFVIRAGFAAEELARGRAASHEQQVSEFAWRAMAHEQLSILPSDSDAE